MTPPPDSTNATDIDTRVTVLEAQLAQLAERHRATCARLAALEDELGVRQ